MTTFVSFLFIISIVTTPLILPSKYWDTKGKQVLIILFSLLIGTGEIWVNTITMQFYFALFSCFLLLSDTRKISGWILVYVLFMIFNAALTGVTSILLLPFFLFKTILIKGNKRVDFVILSILGLGLVIQIISLIIISSNPGLDRLNLANFRNLPFGLMSTFSFGFSIYGKFGIFLLPSLMLLFFLFWFKSSRKSHSFFPFILAFYVGGLFTILSSEMFGGARYGYTPTVLIFIGLVNTQFIPNLFSYYKSVLIVVLFFHAAVSFTITEHFYDYDWVRFSLKNAHINQNGDMVLKLFPQGPNDNWEISVPYDQIEKYR